MERKLLLLGLLRSEKMHGYQLNEFIDSHLGTAVHLTRPTAYRVLNKMADDGWVIGREEREGNRPPRRVFAITPEGEAAFQRLLRENLADCESILFPGHVGLLFLHEIPPEEAVEHLRQRRASVRNVLQMVQAHADHDEGSALMLLHQTRHLATELEWLDEVITHLEGGSQDPAQDIGALGHVNPDQGAGDEQHTQQDSTK
jgi:DNA-binding PadR family transcriptional regulator